MTTLFYAVLLLACSVLADQSVTSSVFRATHNSYSGNLEGQKGTIQYQLDHGVRMIEFDVWDNNYAANKDYSIGHTGPGNAVDHSSPNPSSNLLRDWLRTVNTWSAANPTHAPIQLMLDIKSDLTDNANFAAGNIGALNQAMKDVLGDRLVWAATAPAGLPSVDDLRGKILPVLSGDSTTRLQYKSDTGKNPAVARNNKGHVIEVHDDGLINLWYWSGKAQSDGTVKWLRHGRFDTGVAIAVAINDDGWIVEVHRSQKAMTLWSRVGKFDDETAEITWWPATKYDDGVQPSVTFTSGNTLREVHQSQLSTQRWQWTGTLDTAASPPTVRWTSNSKTSDPFYARTESNGITVYRDSDQQIAYSCGSIVGKRIAYEQIFFVEFQPSNAGSLATGPVYGGASTDKSFVINGRKNNKLVRAWDFDSADRATTPLANYPATNHPYDAWYESLMKSNNAVQ